MLSRISAKTGFQIYVPDYRLAPEFTFEEGSQDVLQVYQEIEKKHPNKSVLLMGDSAGGGLALSIAIQLRDKHITQPERIVLLSPWLDVELTNPDITEIESKDFLLAKEGLVDAGKLWATENFPTHHPYISPIHDSLNDLPPVMLQIGSADILAPDCRKMKEKADQNGLELNYQEAKHMCHAWTIFVSYLPEANKALDEVVEYIK